MFADDSIPEMATWAEDEPSYQQGQQLPRPPSVEESAAKRERAEVAAAVVPPSDAANGGDGAGRTAPPSSAPLLPPDDYEIMRRLEKVEAHLLNVEAMLALAIQVATTAADIAKGRAA